MPRSGFLAATTTFAPLATNAFAAARPMPVVPPEINATFPRRSCIRAVCQCRVIPRGCVAAAEARPFVPVGTNTGSDASLSKEVNICPFDQLRRFNAKASHKTVSFADTRFREFTFVESDLELKKVPQAFDVVQVDTCSSDEKECSMLLNPTHLAVCLRQRLAQRVRSRRWRTEIEGLFRAALVCPTVEDQLPFFTRERAQFQPSRVAPKKGVVLNDLDRTFVRNSRSLRRERLNALDTGLDLDVSRHSTPHNRVARCQMSSHLDAPLRLQIR